MSFPKYPEYKDSGVEWLGEVPAHWDVHRARNLGRFSASGIDKKTVEGEQPVKMFNYLDVYRSQGAPLGGGGNLMETTAPKSKVMEHSVRRGDILLTPSSETADDVGHAAVVSHTEHATVYSYHLIRFRASIPCDAHYLCYWINSKEARAYFSSVATGTTRMVLSRGDFKDTPVPLPERKEQQKIAAFLDHQTGKIDALIEEQRRLIELLKEKRKAVISHAVTKGLDPNLPMKDSGVEWLGKVPEHWGVVSLSRVLSGIDQGWSPTAEAFPALAGDWGVIKLSAIRTGQFVEGNNKKLPDDVVPDSDIEIHAGDLLVTRANTPELVGDACVVRNEPEARLIFSDLVYRLRISGKMTSRFLCYVLMSDVGRAQLQADARGSSMSMAKISHGHIKSCLIPLPPVEEQNRISSRIDQELAAISTLTSAGEQSIGLLTERRSALISAAVTGKIDVRGWQAGVASEEPELAMVAEDAPGYSAQGGAA